MNRIYYEYFNIPVTLMTIAAIVRIIISYVFSQKLKMSSMEKIRNSKYCVQRDGKLVEVEENEIVVGDIIRLGFREEVPASGIIISDNNIFVKEGFETNGE